MATINTLRERIKSYENITDYKLLPKLPIITIINGRGFRKTTSHLQKPFDLLFAECMWNVAIKLMQEADGSIISYIFNDEIVLVSRNDFNINTVPWFDNKIQKISSAISAIASVEFNKLAIHNGLQLTGDATFLAHTFALPTIQEVVNMLICKQQEASYISIALSCFYELLKQYDLDTVNKILFNKTGSEKLNILENKLNIKYNTYPAAFRNGAVVSRTPKTFENKDHLIIVKNKLTLDWNIPAFSSDQDFLYDILDA